MSLHEWGLIPAVEEGAVEDVSVLLRGGVDPNQRFGELELTALMIAAKLSDENKALGIVQHLLHHKADPTAVDTVQRGAISRAAKHDHAQGWHLVAIAYSTSTTLAMRDGSLCVYVSPLQGERHDVSSW